MMPTVSVLMTARNAAPYIAETLASIANQSWRDYEFLIIDDASTDGTWELISRAAANDQRINAWRNAVSAGISSNRNALVARASGTYIAWQDADDVSLSNRLELQVALLNANLRVGACGGYLIMTDADGRRLAERRYATTDAALRRRIFRYVPLAQPAALVRREVYKVIGGYDEKLPLAEDLDFWFRLGTHYEFSNVAAPVLRYRQHNTSATYSRLAELERLTATIRATYANHPRYRRTITDILYGIIQRLLAQLLPVKSRVALFSLLRDNH